MNNSNYKQGETSPSGDGGVPAKGATIFDVYPLNNITITKAQGSYVWDENGVQYLDMYGGHAVISIGHSHPHWVKRVTHQMEKISFYSNSVHIPLQHELADKLGKLAGKEHYQLFLCNSGAEANENAVEARVISTTVKRKWLHFQRAFTEEHHWRLRQPTTQKLLPQLTRQRTLNFFRSMMKAL
jgi:acetylornithine/succinyldiaminopimelate/putrescine aminotransferase